MKARALPVVDTILVLVMASALWVVAAVVTTVWHELGHALADLLLGGQPVLHHNWVADTPRTDKWAQITITTAGLVASLLQGLICWGLYTLLSPLPSAGLVRLLVLLLTCFGFSTAFGYLLITPFPGAGDMNKIATLVPLNIGWQTALAVAGGLLLNQLAHYAGPALYRLSPLEMAPGYRSTLALFALLPWLAGATLMTVVNGADQPLVLRIFPLFLGFFVAIAVADGPPSTLPPPTPIEWTRPLVGLSLLMLLAALAGYLHLKPGLSLGGTP